jgi:hypothetical protein
MVILAFGSVDGGGNGGGGSSSSTTPGKIDAWVMAQQFVEDKLKSPSTADFGSAFGDYQDPDEVVTDLGGGKFRVRGWVDAQNAFGATIRNHFMCELEYVGNDRWRCTSLQFTER